MAFFKNLYLALINQRWVDDDDCPNGIDVDIETNINANESTEGGDEPSDTASDKEDILKGIPSEDELYENQIKYTLLKYSDDAIAIKRGNRVTYYRLDEVPEDEKKRLRGCFGDQVSEDSSDDKENEGNEKILSLIMEALKNEKVLPVRIWNEYPSNRKRSASSVAEWLRKRYNASDDKAWIDLYLGRDVSIHDLFKLSKDDLEPTQVIENNIVEENVTSIESDSSVEKNSKEVISEPIMSEIHEEISDDNSSGIPANETMNENTNAGDDNIVITKSETVTDELMKTESDESVVNKSGETESVTESKSSSDNTSTEEKSVYKGTSSIGTMRKVLPLLFTSKNHTLDDVSNVFRKYGFSVRNVCKEEADKAEKEYSTYHIPENLFNDANVCFVDRKHNSPIIIISEKDSDIVTAIIFSSVLESSINANSALKHYIMKTDTKNYFKHNDANEFEVSNTVVNGHQTQAVITKNNKVLFSTVHSNPIHYFVHVLYNDEPVKE